MKVYEILKLQLGDETRYYSDSASYLGFCVNQRHAYHHFITNSKQNLFKLLKTTDTNCLEDKDFNGEYFSIAESEFEYDRINSIGTTKDGKKIIFLQNYT